MTKSGILLSKLKNYGWNRGQILASQAIAPLWDLLASRKGFGFTRALFFPFWPFLGLACSSGSEMNCEQLLVPLRSIKQLSVQLANVALHAKTLAKEEIRTTAAAEAVHYQACHLLANY